MNISSDVESWIQRSKTKIPFIPHVIYDGSSKETTQIYVEVSNIYLLDWLSKKEKTFKLSFL